MKTRLTQLLASYQPRGIIKGRELCLPPTEALNLANDLTALGVAITGVDGWYYVDKDRGWLVQDLGTDFSVPDGVLRGPHSVHESAIVVKGFIASRLSKKTELVSFSLDIPPDWDLFPQ